MESNRQHNAMMTTLRRHDAVAMAERRRRNLVTTSAFTGCRCCYDPNSDGGEYRALTELRAATNSSTEKQPEQFDVEEKKFDRDSGGSNVHKNDDGNDDSDDEFDYLLDEDLPGETNGIKAMEESRRAELEYSMLSREVAFHHGYGTHRQLHPKRVLKAVGLASSSNDRGSARAPPHAAVLHLVDPDSMTSASLDLYLEQTLSQQYPGTIFVRSGGRSTLLMDSELASRAFSSLAHQQFILEPDRDLPALVAIKDGIVVNVCPKLQGLVDSCGGQNRDGDARIIDHAVHDWLERCGVLVSQAPPMWELCFIRPEEDALMDHLSQQVQQQKEEAAELHRFDCGLADCNKSYPHEHVGIKTSEQDGLVVKESEVVGAMEATEGDAAQTVSEN